MLSVILLSVVAPFKQDVSAYGIHESSYDHLKYFTSYRNFLS